MDEEERVHALSKSAFRNRHLPLPSHLSTLSFGGRNDFRLHAAEQHCVVSVMKRRDHLSIPPQVVEHRP